MAAVTLGKTGIAVEKNGFGCLPIQRIPKEDAAYLLRKAADGGMTFFDTARSYTDSEEKVGYAFEGMRDKLVLATKSQAKTGAELKRHLEISLRNLRTDWIDIYQFHNPAFCPKPG
ncbi:MAG: aldo/keto reductase, partial [Lawsonibacter sp.]